MTIATGQPLLASDINNLTFFPIGAILQFSGSQYTRLTSARTADNKAIWTLCNGTAVNGITVPNLVDKFLRGAASPDSTGGADSRSVSIATANLPVHSHGAGTLSVSVSGMSISGQTIKGLTLDEAGSHAHTGNSGTITAGGGGHDHNLSGYTNATNNEARTAAKTLTGTIDFAENGCSGGGMVSVTSSNKKGTNSNGSDSDNPYFTIDATHTHDVTGSTTANTGTHDHSISSITVGEGGSHKHTVNSSNATISGGTIAGGITDGTVSGSTDSIGSGTDLIIDTLPSYYTVVYIMKVA
jgi:hypothetical protein